MAQPRVVIVDERNGQLMGAQIYAILQQEDSYQVNMYAEIPPDVQLLLATPPDLIIPIFSASKEWIVQLLTTLRAVEAHMPVLLVISSEDLPQMVNGLFPGTKDFLVMPLRAAEVRARVRRLLSGNHELA